MDCRFSARRLCSEQFVLLFLVPFFNELKLSWAFAAVPLHFLQMDWPVWGFGTVIGVSNLLRVPLIWLYTRHGDWAIVPVLTLASGGAAYMLAAPEALAAVLVGTSVGHTVDTTQVQQNLVYLLLEGDPGGQKRALRLQAFAATFGYSSGALIGGAMYEYTGFVGCSVLQLCLIAGMLLLTASSPVVHRSFQRGRGDRTDQRGGEVSSPGQHTQTVAVDAGAVAVALEQPRPHETATLRNTTSACLFLPASMVLLCDGLNIFAYICEWTLFAIFFKQQYNWSSTLTGAAQMAGDILAAAFLALTTTAWWQSLMKRENAATKRIDRLLLQPPWNLPLFFVGYALFFTLLAQPVFALSVCGQIFLGTIYVFLKQAVVETYLVLSHGSLPLFRQLEFLGSCSFNLLMAISSAVCVHVYLYGRTAPFYMVVAISGGWAAVITVYFLVRLRGHLGETFEAAEAALLERRRAANRNHDGQTRGGS